MTIHWMSFRFLAELVLNGVLRKDGVQLLGSVLSYLVATDKTEHVHVSILMPLCRSALFDLTGVAPLKYKEILARRGGLASLTSNVLEEKQKISVKNLLKDYFYTLLNHVNEVRVDMNRLRKTIKRQERTKGTKFSVYLDVPRLGLCSKTEGIAYLHFIPR